jgi:hypothetical protein
MCICMSMIWPGASPSTTHFSPRSQPVREADYAKWMLEDPPVNFAISTRGTHAGIDHLGIQTDDPAELAAMKASAESG